MLKPKQWSLVLLILCPLAVWLAFKPIRVLAPSLLGLKPISEEIYTDAPQRAAEALKLYEEAVAAVEARLGSFEARPRVIFCAAPRCFEGFGFKASAARAVGTSGIVVAPRGWAPHYLRHEMIHHLQGERLGLSWVLNAPRWRVEGMAYDLSDDPRQPLTPRLEALRARFRAWRADREGAALWSALE